MTLAKHRPDKRVFPILSRGMNGSDTILAQGGGELRLVRCSQPQMGGTKQACLRVIDPAHCPPKYSTPEITSLGRYNVEFLSHNNGRIQYLL